MHFMIMWSIKWFPSTNRKWYVIKYIAAQRKIFLLVITMKVNPVWISSRICAFDFIYKQNNKSSTMLLRHSQVGDKLSSLFTWSHDHLCNWITLQSRSVLHSLINWDKGYNKNQCVLLRISGFFLQILKFVFYEIKYWILEIIFVEKMKQVFYDFDSAIQRLEVIVKRTRMSWPFLDCMSLL